MYFTKLIPWQNIHTICCSEKQVNSTVIPFWYKCHPPLAEAYGFLLRPLGRGDLSSVHTNLFTAQKLYFPPVWNDTCSCSMCCFKSRLILDPSRSTRVGVVTSPVCELPAPPSTLSTFLPCPSRWRRKYLLLSCHSSTPSKLILTNNHHHHN